LCDAILIAAYVEFLLNNFRLLSETVVSVRILLRFLSLARSAFGFDDFNSFALKVRGAFTKWARLSIITLMAYRIPMLSSCRCAQLSLFVGQLSVVGFGNFQESLIVMSFKMTFHVESNSLQCRETVKIALILLKSLELTEIIRAVSSLQCLQDALFPSKRLKWLQTLLTFLLWGLTFTFSVSDTSSSKLSEASPLVWSIFEGKYFYAVFVSSWFDLVGMQSDRHEFSKSLLIFELSEAVMISSEKMPISKLCSCRRWVFKEST
jgi:hypothetical protein